MRNAFSRLILATLAAGTLTSLSASALAADAAAAPAKPAAPAAATAPAAAAAHYSVETTVVGKLLDDPVANELLKKMIPSVYANEMFQTMGRELTLKAIQQFEPEALSEQNLAKIQAEFNKIPAKS